MKIKFFLYLFFVACLFLEACKHEKGGFEVKINLKNAVNGPVYVSRRIPNPTQWFTDTIWLQNGKGIFRGKVDYPQLVNLGFRKSNGDFYGSVNLFLDNSCINIEGDFNELKNVKIKGSATHDEYISILQKGKLVFRDYQELSYKRSKAFKDNRALYDSLTPLYREAYQRVFEYIINLSGYNKSQVVPYFVREYFNTDDMDKLGKALEKFDASMFANAYVAECKESFENEKKTLPGQKAYDFVLSDIYGKKYKLSDFQGKYVLLEFSASWCGWCKLEIPFLQTVYENTKEKDFVMLTINLDEEREKWKEDVERYNVPWPVVSDLNAFKSPVAQHYNISGIPMIYLIDPHGIIKKKGLRREAMIEYIDSLWKKDKN